MTHTDPYRDAVAQAVLLRLRGEIARLEGRPAGTGQLMTRARGQKCAQGFDTLTRTDCGDATHLTFGLSRLDRFLGGGMLRATLHDVRAGEARDGASAAGFILGLAARSVHGGSEAGMRLANIAEQPVIWIRTVDAGRETGDLYAPGLAALGLEPSRLVRVSVDRVTDALWAFEASLSCSGIGLAVCEVWRGADAIDLTATRRCAFRARQSGVTGIVLRMSGAGIDQGATPSAAETRWRVEPAHSGGIGLSTDRSAARFSGVGRAAWRLTLERNRNGRTGSFTVEWNAHERRFIECQAIGAVRERGTGSRTDRRMLHFAHPEPVAATAGNGSAGPYRGARQAVG